MSERIIARTVAVDSPGSSVFAGFRVGLPACSRPERASSMLIHGSRRGRVCPLGPVASTLACVLLLGCGPTESSSQDGGRSIADRFVQDSNAREGDSQPAHMPKRGGSSGDDRALATVNGRPIERGEVVGLLLRGRGLPLLQQIIMRDLSRQEA